MLKIIRVFIILVLSNIWFSSANATQPYFGVKDVLQAKKTHSSSVVLYNYTNDIYTVSSLYLPTHNRWTMFLGPRGSSTDTIVYDLYFPDYSVCLEAIRNYDGYYIDFGCLSSQDIYLSYHLNENKPLVKMIK